METDHNRFQCTNCSTSGHASWDCLCPRFLEECSSIESLDAEHTYKYFPNQEAWMWEQVGNKAVRGQALGTKEDGGRMQVRTLTT